MFVSGKDTHLYKQYNLNHDYCIIFHKIIWSIAASKMSTFHELKKTDDSIKKKKKFI